MDHFRTAEQVRAEFGKKPRRALVITTVVYESRAVQSHLSDIEYVTGSNDTLYQLGTFSDPAGDWSVIHAICQAGNADAAVTASGAYRDFGNFDVQMFVGVGGSLKEDVPIGSVVIGNYVYNAHSAKVDDEGHYSRPHGHAAARELLQAATMLILDGSWVDLIKPPFRMELPVVADYPCTYPPAAEIKAIASGEEVVAGGKTPAYQNIRKFLSDAAAVEMEGWGAMSAAHSERTSAIVIRGISDMCAGKDYVADQHYQPIASAHAAAFAFSILSMRSRARPAAPTGNELQPPASQSSALRSDPRMEFVINFKGALSDWPTDRVESIIEGLRTVTGDQALTLVRVEEGSVRVVVNIRERDLSILTPEVIREVSGDAGRQLIGAVTVQELSQADQAKAALRQASAGLLSWEKTLPDGGWLERSEKWKIESYFAFESSSVVLLGEPGSGKSALLAAIATDLIKAEAPVLAIKADFLSTSVHSESDLQAELCLPDPPSTLIERLARFQPVFLLIDQLDALASQLDLRSDRLNVLLNLVRKVGALPNVHIVLSARTFEFNHDVRLRAIEAEAVTLALPAWHVVKESLVSTGIDADSWPENAREVVRNPQALKTYLSLNNSSSDPPFSKYQSMLEKLWWQKIATVEDGEALALLASDLAGAMAEEETLWLAASRFDNRGIALDRLEATGLIVRSDDGKSIAFSHQTVFDFTLARSFVRAVGQLSSYVIERQDSLFVRAKLWSALRYLRDVEAVSYEREFMEIWGHQDLRRHLRLLLIEFLGELNSPITFEKICLQEVMQSIELRRTGLKSIVGSVGWFNNFAHSVIPVAMVGDEIESGYALRILQKAWSFAPDDVILLLRKQWLIDSAKDPFTWSALDACSRWTSDVEEIAQIILSRTDISAWQIDYTASVLAVEQPEVAFRLVRAKFDFLLAKARATPIGKPYPTNGPYEEQVSWHITDAPTKPFSAILEGSEWTSLSAMAEAQPQKFLAALWPWFNAVFSELLDRQRPDVLEYSYPGIYAVDLGLRGDTSERFARERPIISSLRVAVEGLAAQDQTYFLNWVEANGNLDFMALQRLIAHGFGCAPQYFAQRAFEWLFEDPRRLRLGNSNDHEQTTVELIKEVAPYWTDEQVRDFESKVQSYRPIPPAHIVDPKHRRHFSSIMRTAKARLLASLPQDRWSEQTTRLIAVERRAIGGSLDPVVHQVEGGFIGSPMKPEAMKNAKDRDILKLFNEIPDSTNWDHPSSWMRGGNVQLSRAFAEFAKVEPARALHIMERFEPGAQERAAGYTLDSIAELGGHDQVVQEALLDLHHRGFGTNEFKGFAAHAIDKMASRSASIYPSVIDVLTEWLQTPLEGDDTSNWVGVSDANNNEKQEESREVAQESILWGHGGISILPGGNFPILSALTSTLLKDEEKGRDHLFSILNSHLLRERNPKVWQALLFRLSHAGGSTPEVVSQFLRALFARYPSLLETREAVYFLAHAQRWDDALVYDLIATWNHAANPMLQQAQGELVGLISIVRGSCRWIEMRDLLLEDGSPEAKIGLAYAGANLWNETQLHAAAGSLLERLISGADKIRTSAIVDVFRLCDDLVSEPTTLAFLRALAAPHVDLAGTPSTFIVEKLQTLLPYAADIVADIALKLVEAWRGDLSDMRTATAFASPQLADLAITLHRLGGASRKVGVTLFEALIDLDAYGARDTLAEIDGRFGVIQPGIRQRITRRTSKRGHSRAT